jgi:SAM-dependent methyltransferase
MEDNMGPERTDGDRPQPTPPWPTRAYTPRHAAWPYGLADFARRDAAPDAAFYAAPRFVTHVDNAALAALRSYYAAVLPRCGRLLDLCSSWTSHYPRAIVEAAAAADTEGEGEGEGPPPPLRVTGLGMNAAELAANAVLNDGRVVADLNENPDVGAVLRGAGVAVGADGDDADGAARGDDVFDASTLAVSIDYLTDPVAVLRSLRRVTREHGTVHLAVSNRCFPTKVIARWSNISEEERLDMVGDFLHFAGWRRIEIVELSNGISVEADSSADGLRGYMNTLDIRSRDPLWVVRGAKE